MPLTRKHDGASWSQLPLLVRVISELCNNTASITNLSPTVRKGVAGLVGSVFISHTFPHTSTPITPQHLFRNTVRQYWCTQSSIIHEAFLLLVWPTTDVRCTDELVKWLFFFFKKRKKRIAWICCGKDKRLMIIAPQFLLNHVFCCT